MKTIAIHQPEYFPCLSYLDKVKKADVFVLLDDVQFNRASLQQRAKIADKDGQMLWMSIPFMHKHPQKINEVKIVQSNWAADHINRIHHLYSEAPYYSKYRSKLTKFFDSVVDTRSLEIVTKYSLWFLVSEFFVEATALKSSTLKVDGVKGERVLNICRELGATRYLSGKSGFSYLDKEAFTAAGVEIIVQDFTLPVYRANQPDPEGEGRGLSALDALMYLGDGAGRLLP